MKLKLTLLVLTVVIVQKTYSFNTDKSFPLSIIHINDFHARFEATNQNSGQCSEGEKCIGGYARLVHKVKELQDLYKDENPIFLNAGDSFQGTLWYNIGRWNVTKEFLNYLSADAIVLGNHEFDHGIKGVVPFMEQLNSPVVVANIDDSKEPCFQGKYNKSIVIERSGRKIGIIGVILQTTNDIANTEKLKFYNEIESVRSEAEVLTKEGVDIIIVLSHCGYDIDQKIAAEVGPHIDVIVGSHTHTFLYSGDNPPGPEIPRGPYPTVITQEDSGHRVLIVQASAYTKYVGDIKVYFNEHGKIVRYEGNPHYLDNTVPQDAEIMQALKPWRKQIDAVGNTIVGYTAVRLSKHDCGYDECNLGNFFTDALVATATKMLPNSHDHWTNASIGIINQGALRVPLEIGNLTYNHIVTTSPFENKMQVFNLPGDILLQVLEYSINSNTYLPPLTDTDENDKISFRNMIQVSGLKILYDVNQPDGNRVLSVLVRCQRCEVPHYEELEEDKMYRIASVEFLANGGDGFHMINEHKTDVVEGPTDVEMLVDYLKYNSPITTGKTGRISFV